MSSKKIKSARKSMTQNVSSNNAKAVVDSSSTNFVTPNSVTPSNSTTIPLPETSTSVAEDFDCCICMEAPLHPIKLPCSHIFCFLCIKGVFLTDGKCPYCRTAIPKKCIEEPSVLGDSPQIQGSKKRKRSGAVSSGLATPTSSLQSSAQNSIASPPRQVWFYKGRAGGWWQYDERTMVAIEDALSRSLTSLEVILAGSVYVLDFVAKIQMRKDNPSMKRQMKKDFVDSSVKGVAGLMTSRR